MLQFRPRGPAHALRDPFYAVQRDIAYIGPELVYLALCGLDDLAEEEWFKKWCEDKQVMPEDLERGTLALAKALNNMDQPVLETLKEDGFFDLSSPAQAAFYINLGKATLAAIHSGIRDTHDAGSKPQPSIQELSEIIIKVYKEIYGKKPEGAAEAAEGGE